MFTAPDENIKPSRYPDKTIFESLVDPARIYCACWKHQPAPRVILVFQESRYRDALEKERRETREVGREEFSRRRVNTIGGSLEEISIPVFNVCDGETQERRFCIGDKFFLCENKILCESDYEERLVFANMAVHPPSTATLAHIKRQVIHLQPQIMSPSPQRSVNGETTHNHNGYAAPASSSAHNILTSMNNLNGINAQTPYDTK
ncbi:unnamed protein product [Heterotrigona itama]|uniref:Uncharacterized protein n=1 Tax=Heterotrigona itama TaxID=395501 RepID=A0A6V7HDH8_9HYME|nr:unnamed protein product [Heterotrigona itama]